ncbi:ABC transporter substrate-binding protein [Intrasporangium sp.]|uniref:ABC transporter substrate-binding protein n=1 Tax=Intrasporangium sp. TaxID=1925024 RepID=UPI002647B1BF|nr:ABC transporter substrate-binding protein [Intrasporangium sp.]
MVALLPPAVKDKGVLAIGMEAQYPPFEFYDTDNKTVIGFDADVASSLAKLMGLKLEIHDAAFDSIIPSLASGRYDLGISGFTVTAERAKQVNFVTYYYEGDGLMVKAGNPGNLTIGDSLCGVRIAVLKGSTQALKSVPALDKVCTSAGKPAIAATVVPGSNDLGLSLQSGRVQAVLTDGSNAGYTAKLSGGKFEVATGQPYNPAPFGIASPKDNDLDKAVQKALEVMISNGTYASTLKKWNMEAGAVQAPKINEISG